jgi:putative endonuclease
MPLYRLVYYEWSIHKDDAIDREKYLKSGMGKKFIRNRLKNFLQVD